MIPATTYSGQRVAVFGLGRTGVTSALSLAEGGASVLAWDDNSGSRDSAADQGVPVADLRETDWNTVDALLLSPGVPHNLPKPHWTADMARRFGVPIISDIEVFAREVASSGAKVVAITGTNGKSTTTSLVGHILTSAGRETHVGGNIGRGVLDLAQPTAKAVYVLELSSYQLERAPSLHADVAVLLNLSPDHLDRHGDMAGYEAAKRKIFSNQTDSDTAVLGVDDAVGKRIVSEMKAAGVQRVVPVSTISALAGGISAKGGVLFDGTGPKVERIFDLSAVRTLRGRHNHQNAACAYAVCRALGLSAPEIARGLKTFPGLVHRMEWIAEAGGVQFVNDSKATNADSARQALAAYSNIYWIAGGLPKAGGLEPLSDLFDRVTKAYLIGAAGAEFARTLDAQGVAHEVSGEMDIAVMTAARDALADGEEAVILLSPACASFDQFKDYEARGESFRNAVAKVLEAFKA